MKYHNLSNFMFPITYCQPIIKSLLVVLLCYAYHNSSLKLMDVQQKEFSCILSCALDFVLVKSDSTCTYPEQTSNQTHNNIKLITYN